MKKKDSTKLPTWARRAFEVNNSVTLVRREQAKYRSRIEDVSDSQLMVVAPARRGQLVPLAPGEWLGVEILQGRVANRIGSKEEETSGPPRGKAHFGVEFHDVHEGIQDRLFRYIFERQTELRKKGEL